MMKIVRENIVYGGLVLGMLVISAVLYPSLPDMLPRQWSFSGEVNSYWPKEIAVLVMPALALFLWIMKELLPRIDPRREQYDKFKRSYARLWLAVGVFIAILHVLTLTQYDNATALVKGLLFGIALLFAVIGNEMGRFQQTFFVGIRTPWTLADERVWRKTHRVGARWMTLVGVVNMVQILFVPMPLAGVLLVGSTVILMLGLMVYSYVIFQQMK